MKYKKFFTMRNHSVVMEIVDCAVNKVYILNKVCCVTFISRLGFDKFLFVRNNYFEEVQVYIINENIQTNSTLRFSHFIIKHLFDSFYDIKK